MKASKLMMAVYGVYSIVGDEDYAGRKTNSFLFRCGCRIEDGPDQDVDINTIKRVAHDTLDADYESQLLGTLSI